MGTPDEDVASALDRLMHAKREHDEAWYRLQEALGHVAEAKEELEMAGTERERLKKAMADLRTALEQAEEALAAEMA